MTNKIRRPRELKIVRRPDTGTLQITGTYDGKRYRISAGPDFARAKQQLINFISELESGWRPSRAVPNDWQKIVMRIHRRHKSGAKSRDIPFDISPGDVWSLIKESGFHCPLSGIEFSKIAPGNDPLGLRDPWGPSIDRIDNRQGYVRGNIRVVCVAVNMAMNNWGYDVLLRLANGIARNAARAAVPETDVIRRANGTDINLIDYSIT
jgi:hypothetical protein